MIISYLGSIDDFEKIDFLIREEVIRAKMVTDFFTKNVTLTEDREKHNICRAELFVTKERDEIVIRHENDSGDTNFTVLTGCEARAFMAQLAPELENRVKSIELLQKRFLTKSTPPEEIKLPKGKEKSNAR